MFMGLVALCWMWGAARADEPFIQVMQGTHPAYIVPEPYAAHHRAELMASIPRHVEIESFWTPTEADVAVAERIFRELLQQAAKNPMVLFPDLGRNSDQFSIEALKREQDELVLIGENYDAYTRQYVGIVVLGHKLILCNYADVPKVDPATEFLFLEKYFDPKGTVHFLQSRFDPDWKTCAHVSIIGSWQGKE